MTNLNAGLRTSDDAALDPALRHAVLAALDDLVSSAGEEVFTDGQEGFAEWAAQAARLVPYGDRCDRCATTIDLTSDRPGRPLDVVRYPRSATVTLGSTGAAWLEAGYHCHACGSRWTREWAVNAPWASDQGDP